MWLVYFDMGNGPSDSSESLARGDGYLREDLFSSLFTELILRSSQVGFSLMVDLCCVV